MTQLRAELGLVALAIAFLTRIPVPVPADPGAGALGRAARWFPAVGLAVGAAGGGVWAAGILAGLPPLAAAALAVGAQLLLTGALHEDGLADVADGLGGGADRARALEIMRDSRIGAYGALALAVALLLRTGALAGLSPGAGAAALAVAGALGRAGIVAALATMPYARPQGLASGAAGAGGAATLPIALGTGAGAAVLLGGAAGAAAILAAAAAWGVLAWRLMRRLHGYTGDGLGALEQAAHIAALLAFAAAWG